MAKYVQINERQSMSITSSFKGRLETRTKRQHTYFDIQMDFKSTLSTEISLNHQIFLCVTFLPTPDDL